MNNEEKILAAIEKQGAAIAKQESVLENLSAVVVKQGAVLESLVAKVDNLEQGQAAMQADITEVKHRVILMENDIKQHNGAAHDSHILFDRKTDRIQASVDELHEKHDKHDMHIIRLDAEHEFSV